MGKKRGLIGIAADALIGPMERREYRRLRPNRALDVGNQHEVLLETHRAVPQMDFEAPGMTHHMLAITLSARTRMHFSWPGATYDGAFRDGDLILLPAGQSSRCRWTGTFGEALIVYFAPSYLTRLADQEYGCDVVRLEFEGRPKFNDPGIFHISRMLRDAAGGSGGRLLTETLAVTLGILALRSCAVLPLRPVDRGGLSPTALAHVLDYIDGNLAADIALSDLAAIAGCSLQHFKRAFKASTSEPPHRYLLTRRIGHAQALLQADAMSTAEVALACGFASQSHFTTAFRLRTQLTPHRWRRMARE